MSTKGFQYFPQVFSMDLHCAGIYQDVVQEDEDKIIKLIGEDIVHHIHELQKGIGNTERHHQEFR